MILVDASNAFNNLNREVTLRNILTLCPALSKIIINTYRDYSKLFVGGESILSQEGTTQGDPLAMAMYAVAILPLIDRIKNGVKRICYADDAAAGGLLTDLREWWDQLCKLGSLVGYFVNPSKTWIIVKEDYLVDANKILIYSSQQRVSVTWEQHWELDLLLRCMSPPRLRNGRRKLSSFALTQPHAAYAAFVHGLVGKWTYLARTVPYISNLFLPLEHVIRHHFLPALTGRQNINDQERELLSLPARLGGIGIINPCKMSDHQFDISTQVTYPLTTGILQQTMNTLLKLFVSNNRLGRKSNASTNNNNEMMSALPIEEHGFSLHKSAFRDAISLRYGWHPSYLLTECTCGKKFTVDHAFSCLYGGFPSLRHNEVRDITTQLLCETCHNVSVEPELQPLSGEQFTHGTANVEDGARFRHKSRRFLGR